MKKIVTLLSIPVALLVAWGGASLYVGQQTKSTVEQFIDQQNQQAAGRGVKQELVSYEKTTFGAKAITKLKFDMPPFNEVIGEVQFVNDIENGPIFLGGGSAVQFGMSRINTRLDMDKLDAAKRQTLTTAFAGKPPMEGHTVIGFGGSTTYDFSMNPMKLDQDGTIVTAEGFNLSGTSATDMTGKINVHVGKLEIKEANSSASIPSMDVTGNVTGMVGEQVLGNFEMKAPQVSILAEGTTEPAVFDLAVQTSSDIKDNEVVGSITLGVDNIKGVKDTVSKLSYKLDIAGMDVDGLKEVSKLQAEMQSALSQSDWNADAMETPEGQQKQQELMEKVSKTSEQVVNTIFSKVLKTGKSRLHSVLAAESTKGKLNADIDLTYTGKTAPNMMELASYGPADWSKMVQGKVLVDADKAVLPEGSEMMLTPFSEQGLLKLDGTKIKSELTLAGESVTLNGKQMSLEELLQLLAPDMRAAAPGSGDLGGATDTAGGDTSAADLGIPPELMARIQKEGLTPELLKTLEESGDVPKETLDMFKQLQQMQEAVPAEEKK